VTTLSVEMRAFVDAQRLGYHATVCPDGTPNLAHAGTMRVYDDGHLFFADIRSAGTVANLRLNPAIEVNVVDVFARRGYRFKGTGSIHEGDGVYRRAMRLLGARGQRMSPERVRTIVLIAVDQARAISSPAYDDGKTTEVELVRRYLDYYVGLHSGSGSAGSPAETPSVP
jgi:predicted pyridoxine 5'-phosphate oxidase superfamily flavin-nucleotide-binding protein